MAKLRVHNFSMSLDGYGAGPDQAIAHPLGIGGERLHEWFFASPTQRETTGDDPDGAPRGVDDDFVARGDAGIGATIMGRHMFGPIRGAWPDESWRGWWGDDPPFHHAVFVLTHHLRPAVEMEGGTTFHFVDGDLETVLERAFDAAGGRDVRLGGGVSTVQQYLRAGLVDELHVAMVPTLLGAGERLFDHLDSTISGYEVTEFVTSPSVAHVVLTKVGA